MRKLIPGWMVLLFALPLISVAQEVYTTKYLVQYELTYRLDSTNLKSSATETLYLFTGSKQSVFMNHNTAHAEEIEVNLDRLQRTTGVRDWEEAGARNSIFEKMFYKNLENKSVWAIEKILDKKYGYQEPDIPLEWEVGEEIQSLYGYTVQVATTSFAGRDYIAWFTMEVPILDGPYLFSGLPGLIVELFDTEQHYHFKMLSVEKLEKTKTWKLPKYAKVTREDFIELKKKGVEAETAELLHDVRSGRTKIGKAGGGIMSESEVRRSIKKKKESKNNPIELE